MAQFRPVKKLIASVMIGGAAAAGVLVGGGAAHADVSPGNYRYCNTEFQGFHVPVPWCSDMTVRNHRLGVTPSVRGYPITTVGKYEYVNMGQGNGLKMYKTRNGYAGSQYQGNKVIAKFVLTRKR